MSLTSPLDHPALGGFGPTPWSGTPPSNALPQLMRRASGVVAMRQRNAIAHGALADRAIAFGDRLVSGNGLDGQTWWLPADVVWIDGENPAYPEHPRSTGLATATSREKAVIAGLSDRLGWEAVMHLERGGDLPLAEVVDNDLPSHVTVLDGRLDHDLPTVVVVGQDFVRWAAGGTWDAAVRRAIYGDEGRDKFLDELEEMADTLGRCGLDVVVVALDSGLLREAGITRCSTQLVVRTA